MFCADEIVEKIRIEQAVQNGYISCSKDFFARKKYNKRQNKIIELLALHPKSILFQKENDQTARWFFEASEYGKAKRIKLCCRDVIRLMRENILVVDDYYPWLKKRRRLWQMH